MTPAMLRDMAKKRPGTGNDATFKFRCQKRDLELFEFASRHGYEGNISLWLRHIGREAAAPFKAAFEAEQQKLRDQEQQPKKPRKPPSPPAAP